MPIALSAPGKVLLAGGYLALDRAYTGLVFGLDARIHVVVDEVEGSEEGKRAVTVKSPQFRGAEWRYSVVDGKEEKGGVVAVPERR